MAQFSVCASLSFFNFCFQKKTCKILLSFGKRKNTAWLVICLCVLVLLCQQIAAFFYIIITAFYLCVLCEFYYWCLHFLQQKQQLPSSQLVPTAQNWIRRRIFIFFSSDFRSGRFGFCKSVWIRNRCNTIPAAKNITNGRF